MKATVTILIFFSLLTGCIKTGNKLALLELGMSRQEVIKVLGSPLSIRASKEHSDMPVVLMDYGLRHSHCPLVARDHYWMMFKENQLVQWGEMNDFGQIEKADYTQKLIIQEQDGPKPTQPPRFQLQ